MCWRWVPALAKWWNFKQMLHCFPHAGQLPSLGWVPPQWVQVSVGVDWGFGQVVDHGKDHANVGVLEPAPSDCLDCDTLAGSLAWPPGGITPSKMPRWCPLMALVDSCEGRSISPLAPDSFDSMNAIVSSRGRSSFGCERMSRRMTLSASPLMRTRICFCVSSEAEGCRPHMHGTTRSLQVFACILSRAL